MVPFIHDISLILNKSKTVKMIYFDLAKAFDSVSNDLILKKLEIIIKLIIIRLGLYYVLIYLSMSV